MESFIKEIPIDNMPNLHNSWRALMDEILGLVDERNNSTGQGIRREINVRVAKSQDHHTQAYVSMADLADNEWLLNQLDGRNFSGLAVLRVSVSRRCTATDRQLINELSDADDRIRELNRENEQLNARIRELECENKDLKTQGQTQSKECENENKLQELKRKLKELLD